MGGQRLVGAALGLALLAACTPASGGAPAGTGSSSKPAATSAPAASAPTSAASAAPTAGPAALEPLSYGLPVPSVNSLDVYVAAARGFFREQGLDVDITVV